MADEVFGRLVIENILLAPIPWRFILILSTTNSSFMTAIIHTNPRIEGRAVSSYQFTPSLNDFPPRFQR